MALIGSSIAREVGLRLLLSPINSNIVTRTACSAVGIVLPVYSTIKAIETQNQHQQQKWLIYWAAYGTFSLVEVFSDKLLSWFPSYHYLKLVFLVWLQLPNVHGAKMLYKNHLQPFFTRHHARVDQIMDLTYFEMVKLISSHQDEIRYARSLLLKVTTPLGRASRSTLNPAEPEESAEIDGQRRLLFNGESDHDD